MKSATFFCPRLSDNRIHLEGDGSDAEHLDRELEGVFPIKLKNKHLMRQKYKKNCFPTSNNEVKPRQQHSLYYQHLHRQCHHLREIKVLVSFTTYSGCWLLAMCVVLLNGRATTCN